MVALKPVALKPIALKPSPPSRMAAGSYNSQAESGRLNVLGLPRPACLFIFLLAGTLKAMCNGRQPFEALTPF